MESIKYNSETRSFGWKTKTAIGMAVGTAAGLIGIRLYNTKKIWLDAILYAKSEGYTSESISQRVAKSMEDPLNNKSVTEAMKAKMKADLEQFLPKGTSIKIIKFKFSDNRKDHTDTLFEFEREAEKLNKRDGYEGY